MVRAIHGSNCWECEYFNPDMVMGAECEGRKHIFCEKSLADYYAKVRADVIDEAETVINEITQKYIERYGADIVELYSEVLTEFVEWLKEKKNDD